MAGGRRRHLPIHDAYFRALFAVPSVAAAFWRERLPAWVVSGLGEWHPEPVASWVINGKLHSHQPDLLFRLVGTFEARSSTYCLLEHKSWPDPLVPVQLDRDLSAARTMLLQDVEPHGAAPVVIPYVLYQGQKRWNVPRQFPNPQLLRGGSLDAGALGTGQPQLQSFAYGFVDIGHEPGQRLARHPWLRAGLLALRFAYLPARQRNAEALAEVLLLLRGAPESLLETTQSYMLGAYEHLSAEIFREAVRRAMPKQEEPMVSKAARELMEEGKKEGKEEGKKEGKEEGKKEGKEEGKKEGKEEGKEEGKREGEQEGMRKGALKGRRQTTKDLVIRLLEHRFGSLSDKQRAFVQSAELAQLDDWTVQLLDAPSLGALLGEG